MSTTPEHLLDLARHLHEGDAGNESFQRGAISRAYYAALHRAKVTFPPRQRMGYEGSHQAVLAQVDAYAKGIHPGRTRARQVHQLLVSLKKQRTAADYQLEEDLGTAEAELALERAARVLDECTALAQVMACNSDA